MSVPESLYGLVGSDCLGVRLANGGFSSADPADGSFSARWAEIGEAKVAVRSIVPSKHGRRRCRFAVLTPARLGPLLDGLTAHSIPTTTVRPTVAVTFGL